MRDYQAPAMITESPKPNRAHRLEPRIGPAS
jgi:hypothetical protein